MNNEILNSSEALAPPKTRLELLAEYFEKRKNNEAGPLEVSEVNFVDLLENEVALRATKPIDEEGTIAVRIDRYNASETFKVQDKNVVAVREETHELETDSRVVFDEQLDENTWKQIEGAPILEGYQDPFFVGEIEGYKILGAVKIDPKENGEISYRTDFFRFKESLNDLERFASGPEKMKDIRIVEIEKGRIGVFTRPQGGEFGDGKVGYYEIASLSELEDSLKDPKKARILDIFNADSGDFGGINDIHLLEEGQLNLIGHIAHVDEVGNKEYNPISLNFDPKSFQISNLEIILDRSDITFDVDPKNARLKQVVYPGGGERKPDGTMRLFSSVSDSKEVLVKIKDPCLRS